MLSRWLRAIAALPFPAVVVIPGALLLVFADTPFAHDPAAPATAAFVVGAVVGLPGIGLAVWSALAFAFFGNGTPAPWDPPSRLVARGPYRFMRNPMIAGVMLVLLAEALLLRSWPLFGWFFLFTAINAVYMPLVEEQGLERRFGDSYRRYRRNVPRWLPRLTPWDPDETGS